MRGADRADLLRQVQLSLDYLARGEQVPLKDIAFTLNVDLAPGGYRLAIVAGSAGELHTRLTRAAARLANADCRQINDRQGTYFFEQPLHPEGKLAILFTGEGAQYLGMGGDLPAQFPEVAEHFNVCDRVSVLAGQRSLPITRAFLVPDDLSPEERAAAEQRLWQLDNAVGSVLMTNWGIYHVLRGLGLQADAFAGHSGGEISALAGAGCLDADEFLFTQLFALGHLLRQQEEDGRLVEAVLLAAGAGRKILEEVISGEEFAVHLAMDNCPHQTVVAGPVDIMTRVEARLRERGIFCERLPFRRPYHTPLFEPNQGPIARMFDVLPVRPPRRPVYSCATARPFPDDPAAIRRLAVEHWSARVEFVRLIENLYADGIRIFVESGPRGNLTSFVEDILRGRPALAVAADVPRRSGLTQLNHLAGQLAAHHVPLRLEYLYARRDPRPVPWAKLRGQRSEVRSHKSEVMARYCGVMDQFLDLQREVTESFLARSRGNPADMQRGLAPHREQPAAPRYSLLGDIIQHEPGKELLTRRRIDLREDLYALDHTLGGRNASALDPDQHGLPVMPMAFSVEMMAEAAATLAPGQRVIGMKRVRLQRWIPLDAEDPVTLEVSARVHYAAAGETAVQVEIRDLGNDSLWKRGAAEALAVDATVLLATRYPEPPALDEFPLTDERPCAYTPAQLYDQERRMFHGPLFQAVCSTDRQGQEGIEGHLRTLPHSGLFRSTTEPDLLTDPLLIDASTHILGCWHLGMPDQTGRVVFPYELGTVQLYGPRPAVGTQLKCRVAVEQCSTRQVSHRIDLIGPEGKLWCRLHPAEYWRFYWPAEYTNYFRHKDRYLLGQRWDRVESCSAELPSRFSQGRACCMRLDPPADLTHPVKRGALAHVSLSRAEWKRFRVLPGPDRRKTEWLFGRIAAKDAVRTLCHERYGLRLRPADLEIDPDPHGRPRARYLGRPGPEEMPDVSITHAEGVAAALAAFGRQVGIDLERVRPRGESFEEIAFDASERRLLDCFGNAREEGITRFWSAREAVAKALGRGQAEGPRSLAVREVDVETGAVYLALGALLTAAFPERSQELLIASTVRDGDWVVAVAFCERTET